MPKKCKKVQRFQVQRADLKLSYTYVHILLRSTAEKVDPNPSSFTLA